ncbi:MAG: TIGR04086 family membrane protein [Bacillota bacterium]|nr:TIGR04086 family membrane protein [Bacillota bacterium]
MNSKGRSSGQVGLLPNYTPFLIARGLLVALVVSLIFLTLNTFILYLSPLSEVYVTYLIFAGTLISILLGSHYVGKRTEEKGWLRGGLTGLFYVIVLIILSFILSVDFGPGMHIITKLFLGFIFGTLGGILGINS